MLMASHSYSHLPCRGIHSGTHALRSSSTQALRHSGIQVIRPPGTPDTQHSKLGHSSIQALRPSSCRFFSAPPLLRWPKPKLILPLLFNYFTHTFAPAMWVRHCPAPSAEADPRPAITFSIYSNLVPLEFDTVSAPLAEADPHLPSLFKYFLISLRSSSTPSMFCQPKPILPCHHF